MFKLAGEPRLEEREKRPREKELAERANAARGKANLPESAEPRCNPLTFCNPRVVTCLTEVWQGEGESDR